METLLIEWNRLIFIWWAEDSHDHSNDCKIYEKNHKPQSSHSGEKVSDGQLMKPIQEMYIFPSRSCTWITTTGLWDEYNIRSND